MGCHHLSCCYLHHSRNRCHLYACNEQIFLESSVLLLGLFRGRFFCEKFIVNTSLNKPFNVLSSSFKSFSPFVLLLLIWQYNNTTENRNKINVLVDEEDPIIFQYFYKWYLIIHNCMKFVFSNQYGSVLLNVEWAKSIFDFRCTR